MTQNLQSRRMQLWALTLLLALSNASAGWSSPPGRELLNLVYERVDSTDLKLDLYLPASTPTPVPVVVMIHGGGWIGGDKLAWRAPELVERGFAVASLNYRLAGHGSPPNLFPACVQDAKAAVRFLRAHAAEYGLDPARFGVWGESAGAQIGCLLALTGPSAGWDVGPNLDQSSAVQAVVDWYGPADLTVSEPATDKGKRFVEAEFGTDPRLRAQGSPARWVHAGAPPFLIQHGDHDELVPYQQSEHFYQQLRQAGIRATLVPIANAGHGLKPVAGLPAPIDRAEIRRTVLEFLQTTLTNR